MALTKKLSIKQGVKLAGLRPEMGIALQAAIRSNPIGDTVITCALDGNHMFGSKHYSGAAIDLRTRDMSRDQAKSWRDDIALSLGREFDAILEDDHLHVEFDPKGDGA